MDNKEHRSETTGRTSLEDILREMNEAGGFQGATLTSIEGLLITAFPDGCDGEIISAEVAFLHKTSRDIRGEVGMAEVDEVTIRDDNRVRLVSRCFTAGGQELILAVIIPAGHYYRRVTNRAIGRIQALLSPF